MKIIAKLFIVYFFLCGVGFGAPVHVVATIRPLGDWVRMVGGDEVSVETLLAPHMSPHTYEPTPRDMRSVAAAAVFVKVGLGLDDWSNKVYQGARSGQTTMPLLLDLGGMLSEKRLLPDLSVVEPAGAAAAHIGAPDAGEDKHGHEHGAVDPHFWLDPTLGIPCVQAIAERLIEVAPERAEVWRAGAARATARLQALDAEVSATLSAAPRREFACFHDAFKYLAARYGLTRVAVIEVYAGKTPGERYLMNVVRDLKKYNIKTVFVEPQLSDRVAGIIAEEAGATVSVLDPLGGTAGREDYESNMRANAAALIEAFRK